MGHVFVALPTCPFGSVGMVLIDPSAKFGVSHLVHMTSDAIGLNDFCRRLPHLNGLRFHPQAKYGRMIQAVLSLEEILVEDIIVRHVTIITMGHLGMRTIGPGDVLRDHHMAIDASLRFVGQI